MLHGIIQKCLVRKGSKCYCMFVDFSRAFDNVPRHKLLYKLFLIGLKGKMFNIICSLCKSIKSCVQTNGILTDYFNCPLGVRQGCMLSPLLFSIFISTLDDYINSYGGEGVKLSPFEEVIKLIMYADDVVLIALSPQELNRHILALSRFCEEWGMKVNTDKTKIMIFRNGGRVRNDERWTLNGKPIDIVSSYKYLGISFATGNTWGKATNDLSQNGMRALAALRGVSFKCGSLPLAPYFKIFEASVVPSIIYGSEVWGYQHYPSIEKVNTKACKQFLGVSSKSPNVAALGECGRQSIYTKCMIRCISYWAKLIIMPHHRLNYKCYIMLYELDNMGKVTWASHIKNVLFKYGFGIVWISQDIGSISAFLSIFSQRVRDIDMQDWFSELSSLNKLRSYREFKSLLIPEQYLLSVTILDHRRALSRLRCSSHKLNIEIGRRYGIDAEDRICNLCTLDEIEDEFHFVLVCPFFAGKRNELPAWAINFPTRHKFNLLLKSTDNSVLSHLSKYVYIAMKQRDAINAYR